jgi:hypothetical protein
MSLVAVFLLIGMCGLVFLYMRQLDQARVAYDPPTVRCDPNGLRVRGTRRKPIRCLRHRLGDVPISRAG